MPLDPRYPQIRRYIAQQIRYHVPRGMLLPTDGWCAERLYVSRCTSAALGVSVTSVEDPSKSGIP
jgi:hypothetical protein